MGTARIVSAGAEERKNEYYRMIYPITGGSGRGVERSEKTLPVQLHLPILRQPTCPVEHIPDGMAEVAERWQQILGR